MGRIMIETAAASNVAVWSVPGHAIQIEYSAAVLEQIRMTAVDGYHLVPHGGVETGGILFGVHQENVVRITAWRPIHCEYAKGPSFTLSERDETALGRALMSFRAEPELASLVPVGWYRSHTRSEILLSDGDLVFFNRFFPQSWQIGLIVRPGSFAPTRAGFFFREANGDIRVQSSYREFMVAPVPLSDTGMAPPLMPEPVADAVPIPNGSSVVAVAEERWAPAVTAEPAQTAPPPALQSWLDLESSLRPPHRTGGAWKWFAAILCVLAAAAGAGYWFLQPRAQPLSLSVTEAGGQLRIAWDRSDRRITDATGGTVDINDHGVRTKVDLTPADLRSGSVVYARQSGDVGVRLLVVVSGGPPVVESTRFVSPGGAAQTATPSDLARPPDADKPPIPSTPPPAARPARPVLPFHAPDPTPRRLTADIPNIAPPKIDNAPAGLPAGLPSVLGSAPSRAPAAPSTPAHPATPVTVTPGRIIWTGKLSKNGRLVIERNHASTGAVSGALPTMAAHVSAYPGDLNSAGITLFTADPRYYQKPLTEKPGAENGWNPTTYTWDPRRAEAIKIVEQPGPQNGFKLVLESDNKLSVVVLEWRATQ